MLQMSVQIIVISTESPVTVWARRAETLSQAVLQVLLTRSLQEDSSLVGGVRF